jgi:ABC-type Na+ efflux pump permease subunit
MVGRVINRTRNLWILIIMTILLLGLITAILVFTSQQKTEIPQKGVFVLGTHCTNGYPE